MLLSLIFSPLTPVILYILTLEKPGTQAKEDIVQIEIATLYIFLRVS